MKKILSVQEDDAYTVLCESCEWWAEFPRGESVPSSNRALVDSLHAGLDHECEGAMNGR